MSLGAQKASSSIYGQFGPSLVTTCGLDSLILSCNAKYQPSRLVLGMGKRRFLVASPPISYTFLEAISSSRIPTTRNHPPPWTDGHARPSRTTADERGGGRLLLEKDTAGGQLVGWGVDLLSRGNTWETPELAKRGRGRQHECQYHTSAEQPLELVKLDFSVPVRPSPLSSFWAIVLSWRADLNPRLTIQATMLWRMRGLGRGICFFCEHHRPKLDDGSAGGGEGAGSHLSRS